MVTSVGMCLLVYFCLGAPILLTQILPKVHNYYENEMHHLETTCVFRSRKVQGAVQNVLRLHTAPPWPYLGKAIRVKLLFFANVARLQIVFHAFARVPTNKESGALLVRLYKDAGAPAIECSPTKF